MSWSSQVRWLLVKKCRKAYNKEKIQDGVMVRIRHFELVLAVEELMICSTTYAAVVHR